MENFEIVTISNRYKDTLDDHINSSDLESQDQARPINERSHITPMSEGSLANLSKENSLNKNLSHRSSWLMPKIEDSQLRQCCVIAP